MLSYTIIRHGHRIKHKLNYLEYALADMIYHLATNPDSKVIGWCYMSRPTMAEEIGISKNTLLSYLENLESKGLITRHPITRHLQTTAAWNVVYFREEIGGAKFEPPVQDLDSEGAKFGLEGVQNLDSGGAKFEPNSNTNNNELDINKHNTLTANKFADSDNDPLPQLNAENSQKEKVAPKRKRFTYKEFIDMFRSYETDNHFNFEINNSKNVGQFINIQKAIEKDLVKKYISFDLEQERNAFQAVLSLAHQYFSDMYDRRITSVLLYEPVYIYSHYSKIKTFKSSGKKLDWNQIHNQLAAKYDKRPN